LIEVGERARERVVGRPPQRREEHGDRAPPHAGRCERSIAENEQRSACHHQDECERDASADRLAEKSARQ
jgi:hypothetical protein